MLRQRKIQTVRTQARIAIIRTDLKSIPAREYRVFSNHGICLELYAAQDEPVVSTGGPPTTAFSKIGFVVLEQLSDRAKMPDAPAGAKDRLRHGSNRREAGVRSLDTTTRRSESKSGYWWHHITNRKGKQAD
jgi:hypothetical protein